MLKIIEILRKLGAQYQVDGRSVLVEDVGGCISAVDGRFYFVHGNAEPSIPADSPLLEKWITAYLGGFDEFASAIQ